MPAVNIVSKAVLNDSRQERLLCSAHKSEIRAFKLGDVSCKGA
jgi:hypothetical protein